MCYLRTHVQKLVVFGVDELCYVFVEGNDEVRHFETTSGAHHLEAIGRRQCGMGQYSMDIAEQYWAVQHGSGRVPSRTYAAIYDTFAATVVAS